MSESTHSNKEMPYGVCEWYPSITFEYHNSNHVEKSTQLQLVYCSSVDKRKFGCLISNYHLTESNSLSNRACIVLLCDKDKRNQTKSDLFLKAFGRSELALEGCEGCRSSTILSAL